MPQADQLGLRLTENQIRRFRHLTGSTRPHLALLNIICVWAVRLSGSPDLRAFETFYLGRSLNALPMALSGLSINFRVEAMQAECLLALYFICIGRLLEGRYHLDATLSIPGSCGPHNIGST